MPYPPRAPLTLRVGVTGHRPDPDKRPAPDVVRLRETIRAILVHVRDCFAGVARTHPILFDTTAAGSGLRVISSLAEGPDQWVAEEAHRLGYELQSPLPFSYEEYAVDFDDPDVQLRPFVNLATIVVELDGDREHRRASYRAAGHMMLRQSDLLIAVWDGGEGEMGGTGEMVHEALIRGIPVVWIPWASPGDWRLRQPTWRVLHQVQELNGDWEHLTNAVRELLLPPEAETSHGRRGDLREQYFSEKHPGWSLLAGWGHLFRDSLSGRLIASFRRPRNSTAQTDGGARAIRHAWENARGYVHNFSGYDILNHETREWANSWGRVEKAPAPTSCSLPEAIVDWANASLLAHYAWANHLSIRYGNLYRSTFVLTFLMGALAVLLALVGYAAELDHDWEVVAIGAELAVIGAIIFLTRRSQRKRWHERWIDYRTLAEHLRLARFLVLLGGGGQQATVPGHLATYGNPAGTWMQWHFRAIERAAGLPRVDKLVVGAGYLAACRELLMESLIEHQKTYHESNATRLEHINRRLHRIGGLFFIATFIACAIHFVLAWQHTLIEAWLPASVHTWLPPDRWLTLLNAVLPAFGAALAAIRNQGEFERVAQRSRAMIERLERLREDLGDVPTRPRELSSVRLRKVAVETAQLMVNENLDWRIVFQDRPPELPA